VNSKKRSSAVRMNPDVRRFGHSLIRPKSCSVFPFSSKKKEYRARKNSCCDGLPTTRDLFASLYASNGISAHTLQ
jgi:hypothetical protein